MILRLFISLFILLAVASIPREVAAVQTVPIISDVVVTYTYGEQIIISGRIRPDLVSNPAAIQVTFAGDSHTLTELLDVEKSGAFTFVHLIPNRFVQAFSTVTFRIIVEEAGILVESEPFSFFYSDNRFNWKTLESNPFRVHWYQGDVAFAQQVLDAARSGLDRALAYFEIEPPGWIDVYVYGNLEDYQVTRGLLSQRWAGGHVEPDTGLVIVSLPPNSEAQLEIERKIPHEIAHLVLYEFTGSGFRNLPVWLNEGFASLMETFPNPDYDFLVNRAVENGSLIPVTELCEAFPQDTSAALLAYAEATAFIRYVRSVYGPAGVRALVESYAAGAGCAQGPLTDPIRLDLQTLEAAWQGGIVTAAVPENGLVPEISGEMLSRLLIFAIVLAGPGLVLLGAGLKRSK